jgi:hypothetical protein
VAKRADWAGRATKALRSLRSFRDEPPLMVVAFAALLFGNLLLGIIAVSTIGFHEFGHIWLHPKSHGDAFDLLASAAGGTISIFIVLYFTVMGPALESAQQRRRAKLAHLNTWLLFWPGVFLIFPFAVLCGTAYGFPRYPAVVLAYAALSPPTLWTLIKLVLGLYDRPQRDPDKD